MKNTSIGKLYDRLLDGDESALVEVYDMYKAEFVNFFRKHDINEQSILDIYQDTIIVVYQKIYCDRLNLTSSSLKTYLFGIGKNKMYDYFKKKQIQNDDITKLKVEAEKFEIEKAPGLYERKLAKNLKLMSDSCKLILKMFYYRGLTIKEIVSQTEYKDENTVKAYKSRCMKKLKELCNS